MSWTRLRGCALGVILLLAACGGGTSSAANPATGGSEGEGESDTVAPAADGTASSEGSTSGAGASGPSGPDSATGGGTPASLAAAALARCEVGEVVHGAHTSVPLVVDPPVGSCWVTEGFGAPGSPPAPPELRALGDVSQLRALLTCQPEAELEAEASASYFALRHVHYASDTWEVVFSEDDGARVHVGLRIRRACQGTPPQLIQATTLLALPGRGRALSVHLCERDPRPCPPVP